MHSFPIAATIKDDGGGEAVKEDHQNPATAAVMPNTFNGREARNRAEKQRRDKLNCSIQDLATMVPHVAESPRRVDKTAILRYSAHGLRIRYVFGKSLEDKGFQSLTGLALTDSLMKLLDGFFLTITCRGQIVLISPSVEQYLGHCQTDLFGQNILHITHPDDQEMLKQQLIPSDLDSLFDIQPENENGELRSRTKSEEEEIDRRLFEDRRCFTLRLAKATPRNEPTQYEIVRIEGSFRRADSAPRGFKNNVYPTELQLIRRARVREDISIPLRSISGNDIVLICVARIIKPLKIIDKLLESNQYEYKTRHLIDGRIIQCDQRISIVAGYMTDEVNGLCPFTFMHQDDVRWVIVALRQMYDSKSSYGESCYRLLTRPGKFIYLRTRGYLDIEKSTNKVHSFVCVNTLVNEEEGKRRCEEMKRKFSAIINTKIPDSTIDAPASDNAHQLEKAVMYLIQNLQQDAQHEESNEIIINTDQKNSFSNSNQSATITELSDSESFTTNNSTQIIDLVPPQVESIKSSISKSVNVVNVTSAKCFRLNKAMHSPISEDSNFSPKSSPLPFTSPKHSPKSEYSPKYFYSPPKTPVQHQQNPLSPCENRVQPKRSSVLRRSVSSGISGSDGSNSSSVIVVVKNEIESEISSSTKELNKRTLLMSSITSQESNVKQEQKTMYSPNIKSLTANTQILPIIQFKTGTTALYQPTSVLKRTCDAISGDNDNLNKRRNLHCTSDANISIIRNVSVDKSSVLVQATTNVQTTGITIIRSTTTTTSANPITGSQKDLSNALTNSFVQINRSLSNIETATGQLKDQCTIYPIPSSQNQLEEIIEEHYEQKEMLRNIRDEYQAHLQSSASTTTTPGTIQPKEEIESKNVKSVSNQQKFELKPR